MSFRTKPVRLSGVLLIFAIQLALAAAVGPAQAVVRAASCFPAGSYFSKRFELILDDIRAAGIAVEYLGGAPKVASPFALVEQMARGSYDLVSCTGAYYDALLPEAGALKLLEIHPAKLRTNGGFEYVVALHRAQNIEYLGRHQSSMPFHLYLGEGKLITRPDLRGLHLRVVPIYTSFFQAMGATTQRSNITQILGYMKDGVVDGYGWPVTGLRKDWHEVTKYRVDPGFYDADLHLLFNLQAFAKLDNGRARCCVISRKPGKARAMISISRRSNRRMSSSINWASRRLSSKAPTATSGYRPRETPAGPRFSNGAPNTAPNSNDFSAAEPPRRAYSRFIRMIHFGVRPHFVSPVIAG